MKTLLLVASGGAIGAVCRYLLWLVMKPVSQGFPWPTFVANIIGCFLIGVCMSYVLYKQADMFRLFVVVGILGGFTTFSSFGFESIALLKERRIVTAILYILSSNMAGLLLVYAGFRLFKYT